VELCFSGVIEDHPARVQHPVGGRGGVTFDLIAALEWSKDVFEEAGLDYASAVDWCLVGSRKASYGRNWRQELNDQIVRLLELCYQYLNPQNMQILAR